MDKFLELAFAGIALGARYALVALGFVVIYRATGVINFAQGGFVALGAYVAYNAINTWDLPFWLAVVIALLVLAAFGAILEEVLLRWFVGRPALAVIMVTIGVLILIQQFEMTVWGPNQLPFGDPWGLSTVDILDVPVRVSNLWTIGLAAGVLLSFFLFFRYSKLGVAMRATALDQEAALAQGISVRRVFATSWAIAGFVAALAGVMIASQRQGASLDIEFVALAAFPAIILGGLESPGGAVIGGLAIGLAQELTAGYQEQLFPFLPKGFAQVMPFVLMVLVLLVRPYGLFGAREVRRV